MKWKKILILGLCLTLMGCGQAGSGQLDGSAVQQEMSVEKTSEEVGTKADEGTASDDLEVGQQASDDLEAGQQALEGDGAQKTGEGSLEKLDDAGGKEKGVSVLDNAYQRAAYFADRIYEMEKKSTLVSPLSLEIALGLATEGASGETAQELYKYLGNEKYADWVEQYMEFAQSLKSEDVEEGQDGELQIPQPSKYSFCYEIANSIWVKKELKLSEDYQKLSQQKFHAQAQNVDFVGQPDETTKLINSWCEERTHGMIPQIVSPDMFDQRLSAILMNTVYFESPWIDKWGLVEHEFTDLNGKKTTQEMLSDKLSAYYENDFCTAFSKNYYNGFRFIGILPKQEGDFQISDLDLKSLLESETYEYDVKAIAPKLNFDTATKSRAIVNILKEQGVTKAFDSQYAEFDRMLEGQELHISDIIQKCKIELDDEGTRAAAVTAILMRQNAMFVEPKPKEVKEVYLDRPFAFLIYDSINDQIMFVGKVTELN